ncbi:Uncharacterized protein PECH_003841 [Penicillium ucsense]|uniref:Apple domain-containing protein n=1 Tax=Penicillium ucsense TaxID=2839758 RepID=A0A8J8WK74_9EURO|nr:Uncharacterized protein PECM_005608 [Penicillium ucsense]KAF7737390.1 Uncharacterized protein PECH_003841 [Penicillium ucsense]
MAKMILPFAFAGLASLGASQSPLPNDAARTCPAMSGQEAIFGGVVKVECDTWYNGYDPIPTGASTQQECAEQCHKDLACKGSTWVVSKQECYPIRQTLANPQHAGGYTTFVPQRDASLPSACKAPSFKQCGQGGDNEVVKVGSVSLKKKCNVSHAKSSMSLKQVIKPGLNEEQCAMLCALDDKCMSVYFPKSTSTVGECQLQTNNIEGRLGSGADVAWIKV